AWQRENFSDRSPGFRQVMPHHREPLLADLITVQDRVVDISRNSGLVQDLSHPLPLGMPCHRQMGYRGWRVLAPGGKACRCRRPVAAHNAPPPGIPAVQMRELTEQNSRLDFIHPTVPPKRDATMIAFPPAILAQLLKQLAVSLIATSNGSPIAHPP